MPRYVEVVIRVDNRTAIRALREFGAASESAASTAGRKWTSAGSAMRGVGRIMTGIGIAAVGVGYESGKMAMNFQTAMTRIHTQAQVGSKKVDELSGAVLKLGASGKVQFGPTQLANALYHIQSVAAGGNVKIRNVAEAMNVLKVASQGAAVGGSNLEETTTALMGVMSSLHAPANQANRIMSLINATVGVGNMRMSDLVTAIGSGIVPAFRNYGLSAQSAFAAIALFSDQGTKASSSSRQLATAIHFLAGPTHNARKALAYLGLDATRLEQTLADTGPHGGLIGALGLIQKGMAHLPQYQKNELLGYLLPAGRGRVLLQALNNLTQLGGKMALLQKPTVSFNEAIKVQANTMQGKLHTSWAKIQTDMTIFGATVLVMVSQWLPKLTAAVQWLFKKFESLPKPVRDFAMYAGVAFAIGGPILIGMGIMAQSIGRLISLYRLLKTTSRDAALAEEAANAAGGGGPGGTGKVAGKAAGKASRGRRFLRGLGHFAGGAAKLTGIGAVAYYGLDALNQIPGGPPGALRHSLHHSGHPRLGRQHGGYIGHGMRSYFQDGGIYPDTVPAWLSPGEGVLNRAAMAGIGTSGLSWMNAGFPAGGGGGHITIQPSPAYFTVDGRVLARAVVRYTLIRGAFGPSSLVGGALATGIGSQTSGTLH